MLLSFPEPKPKPAKTKHITILMNESVLSTLPDHKVPKAIEDIVLTMRTKA